MDTVTSMGVTGPQAKFTIDLARHDLSFRTKVVEAQNLPSSASVALPQVHISADYMQQEAEPAPVPDGVEVCPGSYFSTEAEIGALEHTLSTDLLNHLVFVQKVFMMEVNDVVQKMAGLDKFKSSLLGEEEAAERPAAPSKRPVLYSLRLTFRGIQITATTPTNYAVRLETGLTELQLSNRYQRVGADQCRTVPLSRLYGRAELRVNVSLGQVIRNVVFEEADAEFHQYAYFKTKIGLSNTFHDGGPVAASEPDKEVVRIALRRPLVYVQPMAVDKAILVWLNYRNAYDYWSEQRRTLNKEVLTATQQVLDKVPHISHINVTTLRSTLFLQVTVDDLGICLPINTHSPTGPGQMVTDADSRDALVITLEETAVSAMTCDSLICSGRFTGFCLRFAQDFETSLDDWKPEGLYQPPQSDTTDPAIMNLCVVSEGTYEVCSRTVGINLAAENAKWVLNVSWQMEGVDINVDINIGRHLSALANTLTTFTDVDDEEEEGRLDISEVDGPVSCQQPLLTRRRTVSSTEHLHSDLLLDISDPRKRAKLLENRMNEQAKVVHNLMLHGASSKILEEETRKLEAFESVVFKDFRRDMMKRLRRQSIRAGTMASKGSAPPPGRSRSVHGRRVTRSLNTPADLRDGITADQTSSEESVLLERDEPVPPRVTFSDTQVLLSRHASIDESDEPDQPGPWSRRPPPPPPPRAAASPSSPAASSGSPSPVVEVEVNSVPISPSEVDDVELRRPESAASVSASPTTPKQQPVEPNIHFELDVKVFVSSGRCALHTRDPAHLRADSDDVGRDSKRRGRQHSGFSDESTPSSSRRRGGMLHSSSMTRLKKVAPSLSASIADLTIFHIPGLDVKLHYDSKMVSEPTPLLRQPPFSPLSPQPPPLSKRASLFVWVTLQSIPTETVVSPHILDFLDQLFELLPMTRGLSVLPPSPEALDADPLAAQPGSYAGSFPVDVIVFFHMQPSTFRFSCLPVSKVECLLRLPSLDLVFSSKRSDLELT
ncbi:transmembrane protein KIAA1109 homolog [Pollicipes pollicipes]|uniref:transmembrane protein KIAA1109 homolog n=1 Tax=Pollicipes pollicipes TaxID=41117 RepID=UPI0018858ED1|nr:transmembrane protein KIAA1109 homolog [Pollicipes pollicipes]